MISKCGKNKKEVHQAIARVSLMSLPYFDILCDLLLKRYTATWSRIVLYNLNSLLIDELGNWFNQRVGGALCKYSNARHSRGVPWQSCEREPALQAATNQHCHTEGTSVEKLTCPDTHHELPRIRGGKGWELN